MSASPCSDVTLPVSVADFRADFPEFTSTIAPDSSVTTWATLAMCLINASRIDCCALKLMNELFMAHNLALEAMALKETAGGGIPGIMRGVISSEAAGQVSISYDSEAAIIPGAGHWNLTTFGLRFKQFMNNYSAGPIQIGPRGGWAAYPILPLVALSSGYAAGPGWWRAL